jgi:hypothetical protein
MKPDLLCPSTDASNGVIVLGHGPVGSPLEYEDAIRAPKEADSDPTYTRLAGRCHGHECAYWAGACQLGQRLATVEVHVSNRFSPRCVIRKQCRWFAENGSAACNNCPYVRLRLDPALVDSLRAESPRESAAN